MRRQGRSRIVMNSSVLGYAAFAYRGAYNAVKFAVEGLTDTLRHELHGTGIEVNSPRSADEPASSCRRYPPNAKHSAEGAKNRFSALPSDFLIQP